MIKKLLHEKMNNWSSCGVSDIYKKIDSVDYVSFDIFDTLLKRDVPEPTDVFRIVERKANEKNFYEKRRRAEVLARSGGRRKEITLDDIYSCYSGIRKNILKEIEICTEIELSTINKDIQNIFQYALRHARVILISDMYLPRSIIELLLKKNGISGYEKLYISSEIGLTKANGSIFEYVCNDLKIKPNRVMHIGNSFKADYLKPKKCGIPSYKIATYKRKLQRDYLPKESGFDNRAFEIFLNNHVDADEKYYQFGYEVFGPLLYGFVKWIYTEAYKEGIKQIMFLSRDGFVMKKLYDSLGYNKDIPSLYIEVSRRSLRVPRLAKNSEYEKVMSSLSVPNMTNIIQIFDSLGLDADNYREQVKKHNFNFTMRLKRDNLVCDEKMKELYEEIHGELTKNADDEYSKLMDYLKQFDFSKKTAIVDIGWAGTMQKALTDTLNDMNIDNDIYGYYVGMTKKSKITLRGQEGRAKGYAFDCFNRQDVEMVSSYIGLIESMFLEQDGSVKKYIQRNNEIIAERYSYEYRMPNGELMFEAKVIDRIQKGAFQFAHDYNASILSRVLSNDFSTMYNNMHKVGNDPEMINVKQFGKMRFFNCGDLVYLANPKSLIYYIFHIKELKRDIYDCQWKIGFMKALFRIKLPYTKIFEILRRRANR